ncbi:ESCRT-II complex, Vps25 subunit like protein [Aduncisulcus paluster]|uniref:ESCRT-II complex, Vps25 subunit like protein n=1 Tax=Aduncisulcus paluster TaxID=2918883 RepID=A0ABQ5KUD1_9EUKA|nr:ESCRT-II complex, Vps25 subunit like protein [Aduncisulcus paluster]
MPDFQFPEFHGLPPFYTPQPVPKTREQQIDLWSSLIISYCHHESIKIIDIISFLDSPVCNNKTIERKMPQSLLEKIITNLKEDGHAEWADESHSRAYIFYKSPAEWGVQIMKIIDDQGLLGEVVPIRRLMKLLSEENKEFEGCDEFIFFRSLKELEKKDKCFIMGKSQGIVTSVDEIMGVKFKLG